MCQQTPFPPVNDYGVHNPMLLRSAPYWRIGTIGSLVAVRHILTMEVPGVGETSRRATRTPSPRCQMRQFVRIPLSARQRLEAEFARELCPNPAVGVLAA